MKLAKNKKPGREKQSYYVYVLLCDDGSYYTGYTNNVATRLERHKKAIGARYTRMHRPKRVVYVEEFKTRSAATRREQQIKTLSHKEKHQLASMEAHTRIGRLMRKSSPSIAHRSRSTFTVVEPMCDSLYSRSGN